jgi:ribonuclease P protein component
VALPKVHRLQHRRDFSAVYQKGLRRHGRCLVLRALRTSVSDRRNRSVGPLRVAPKTSGDAESPAQVAPTQIGFSISQKVSKRAVVRNQIRRRLSAALHTLIPQMEQGWWLVIVVRPEATQCDYHQFLQELKQLLVDAEVINGY